MQNVVKLLHMYFTISQHFKPCRLWLFSPYGLNQVTWFVCVCVYACVGCVSFHVITLSSISAQSFYNSELILPDLSEVVSTLQSPPPL